MSAYVCEDKTIQRIIGYLHTAATGNQTHQYRVRGEIDTISCGGLDEETLPAPMTDERGAVIQAAYKKMNGMSQFTVVNNSIIAMVDFASRTNHYRLTWQNLNAVRLKEALRLSGLRSITLPTYRCAKRMIDSVPF